MSELPTSKERLQEAEALIAMLSNDMDQHDFTRGYLPHWRPRLRAFLEGRPATYDPKDAPVRAVETKAPQRYGWCVTGMYKVGHVGQFGPDEAEYVLAQKTSGDVP